MTVEERVQAGGRVQAGSRLAQHGLDQLRASIRCSTATRTSSTTGRRRTLEGTRDLVFRNTFKDIEYILETCDGNGTRFEFECYDIAHLYNLKHFLDRGLVKPPLFVQSVFGILGGIGTHPEDVMHMKRTADRLFGDQYRWSVLGAGAAQMRDRGAGGRDGRQRARRAGGFAVDRPRQARHESMPSRCARRGRSSRASGWRSRRRTRRARSWR